MSSSPDSPARLWAGRILTALPILALTGSAMMKLTKHPDLIPQFVGAFGYPESLLLPIGIVELLCVIVYAVPRTSILGAVLLTGYLGGAIATHVRVGDMFIPPLVLGVLVWGGLYFRSARIRSLLPIRKD
jgi:hypothetical protein